MTKKIIFLIVLVGVVGYILSSGWFATWRQNGISQTYIDKWQEMQKNDKYGGATPEETMALFTDAIKKGDVDLASKYFEVDKQAKMDSLLKSSTNVRLSQFAVELENYKIVDKNTATVIWGYGTGEKYSQIVMNLNAVNKLWKIDEL